MEEAIEEEIIFQVRINRKEKIFELIKVPLDEFEQSGLEMFLETYLQSLKKIRLEDFSLEYVDKEDFKK